MYDLIFSCQYKNSNTQFKILTSKRSDVSVEDIKNCVDCSMYCASLASDILRSRVYNTESLLWYFGMIGKHIRLLGRGNDFATTLHH